MNFKSYYWVFEAGHLNVFPNIHVMTSYYCNIAMFCNINTNKNDIVHKYESPNLYNRTYISYYKFGTSRKYLLSVA